MPVVFSKWVARLVTFCVGMIITAVGIAHWMSPAFNSIAIQMVALDVYLVYMAMYTWGDFWVELVQKQEEGS